MGRLSHLRILMVLWQIASSLTSETGSPQILSFAYEKWDPGVNQWTSTTDVERSNNIRLICTIDSPRSGEFRIEILDGTYDIGHLNYPNSRQIIYEFRNLDCNNFGVYVCDNGLGANKTLELGIFNCEPRLCNEEDTATIMASLALKETVAFDVCVRAYPEIGVAFAAIPSTPKRPTDTDVEDPHQLDDPNAWQLDVEPDSNIFGLYTVRISKSSISRDDYGELKFVVFTIHDGLRKQLNYTIVLEPSETGPPDCPTKLEVSDQKSDSLKLSWQPGFDGGSTQFFLVYIFRDGEWILTSTTTKGNSANISGLEADTQYAFRVIPHNKFSKEPSGNLCHNTLEVVTEKLSEADDDQTNYKEIVTPVCVVLGLLIVTVIGVVALLCYRRNHRMSSQNAYVESYSEENSLEDGLITLNETVGHDDNQLR